MWNKAIEDAVSKVRANMERFGTRFPHISTDGVYQLNDNEDWTNGFWSGMLWLCYEYTGDEAFREKAIETVKDFRRRFDAKIVLDHHDIGFLYSLSSKAQWIIEKDESARQLTLEAADHLLKRWRPAGGGYIQAWGREGDPKEAGRIIIDCLLNLPLLFWAEQQTGDPKYREVAITQAEKTRRYIVRGDDSSYHTFFFDPSTGEPIGGATHQGYTNGSTWTRGQAWGVYGFALAYRYTGDPIFLETSRRMARYFLSHLPEDHVAYWDFNAPIDKDTYRDSSASAIVAAGLQELLEHLDEQDPDREYFKQALTDSLTSLVENYSTIGEEAEGLLKRGSYYVRGGLSPDDYMIWGDYYYLEALMRLEKGIKGYWYER
ncbi:MULTISPECIES: glycoside hydrolase family 88 protein [unclassified Paenibacillus]|uniref:glycoside hydrolase family 88 protein n=1 Tax=unclassified Paenibacillus TaxID=185978 RepID=UPI0008398CF5|nr:MULTISPECIES: glycoside hydrolase family 88 protein [unclassified Paenibacillus]NWL86568.1 glucuronyl hydrolase [Paenibacillus sp. 79R4]